MAERISKVLNALPEEVQRDFLDDPLFQVVLETHSPEDGWKMVMPMPGASGESRCVVLRAKLANCSAEFAYYVIAHEFAHAYLRNCGWNEIDDDEEAADALAASWGFSRPYF